jgi:hypothetical protein
VHPPIRSSQPSRQAHPGSGGRGGEDTEAGSCIVMEMGHFRDDLNSGGHLSVRATGVHSTGVLWVEWGMQKWGFENHEKGQHVGA